MLTVLQLGRVHGEARLHTCVAQALAWGCADPAAVRYLLTAGALEHAPPIAVDVGALAAYDRPQPSLHAYDQLLAGRSRGAGRP
jgi:hypothetical protein